MSGLQGKSPKPLDEIFAFTSRKTFQITALKFDDPMVAIL